ncbi:MAG: PIN domain-containing protein [Anaerolineae bacterium]|nr:PIN domain-containing protein [Anaerolineae bacterium]
MQIDLSAAKVDFASPDYSGRNFLLPDQTSKQSGNGEFYNSQLPHSKYRLLELQAEDVKRAGEILAHYVDTRLDFIDASVIALAERLKVKMILTLDRRDFGMVKPRHCDYFELLP